MSISARLPDAYVAHLARTQAKVNIDVADMSDGHVVDPLIRANDLKATAAVTITEVGLSRWHTHISLAGTATMTFTDEDGQSHTATTICEIIVDPAMLVDTAHHPDLGQRLGLSPEQIQELTNLTDTSSAITYLNVQCEKAPLITDLEWKIAENV